MNWKCWREERAWLGRVFWGEALLGGCWEVKVPAGWGYMLEWLLQLLVRNEIRAKDMGKSGQFEAIMRVVVVWLGRLECDWIAIGS